MDSLFYHRLHFAFTITFHYIFPQLTMGLGLLIAVMRYLAAFKKSEVADRAAAFWTKIFGVNFAIGVITGIPMEFQFGTNWSRFSQHAGGVIGQTLAMEGIFAFFLESSFLYLLLNGKKLLSPRGHFIAALMVMIGSWLSGLFIVITNAWMQHPVGYVAGDGGVIRLSSLGAYMSNPWAYVETVHAIMGSIVTASFVVAATGAFYLLAKRHDECARLFLKIGVIAGFVSSLAMAMPTGDLQSRLVAEYQPATFAAMEGHFETEDSAGMVLIGQPNYQTERLDNPIIVPKALSFLTHQRWNARIVGLEEFPRSEWPDNPELLYYAYHSMVGLGTIFIALMSGALLLLFRKKLDSFKPALWALMLALPFPYIANTAGWLTAELGRQPWLVYGVMRTKDGSSDHVSSGNVLFSLLGWMGFDAFLGLLFFALLIRIVGRGPIDTKAPSPRSEDPPKSAAETSTQGDEAKEAT